MPVNICFFSFYNHFRANRARAELAKIQKNKCLHLFTGNSKFITLEKINFDEIHTNIREHTDLRLKDDVCWTIILRCPFMKLNLVSLLSFACLTSCGGSKLGNSSKPEKTETQGNTGKDSGQKTNESRTVGDSNSVANNQGALLLDFASLQSSPVVESENTQTTSVSSSSTASGNSQVSSSTLISVSGSAGSQTTSKRTYEVKISGSGNDMKKEFPFSSGVVTIEGIQAGKIKVTVNSVASENCAAEPCDKSTAKVVRSGSFDTDIVAGRQTKAVAASSADASFTFVVKLLEEILKGSEKTSETLLSAEVDRVAVNSCLAAWGKQHPFKSISEKEGNYAKVVRKTNVDVRQYNGFLGIGSSTRFSKIIELPIESGSLQFFKTCSNGFLGIGAACTTTTKISGGVSTDRPILTLVDLDADAEPAAANAIPSNAGEDSGSSTVFEKDWLFRNPNGWYCVQSKTLPKVVNVQLNCSSALARVGAMAAGVAGTKIAVDNFMNVIKTGPNGEACKE
jgi:hypothetical protein